MSACWGGPWDEKRDARKYAGPHPVVAHPPCQRWGRFWHGSTRKPHQYKLGDDGGCFAAALAALKRWGGVLEHPAHSKAWEVFGIRKPLQGAGWWWCPEHHVGSAMSSRATTVTSVGKPLG